MNRWRQIYYITNSICSMERRYIDIDRQIDRQIDRLREGQAALQAQEEQRGAPRQTDDEEINRQLDR